MKRFLYLFIVVLSVFSLSACGGEKINTVEQYFDVMSENITFTNKRNCNNEYIEELKDGIFFQFDSVDYRNDRLAINSFEYELYKISDNDFLDELKTIYVLNDYILDFDDPEHPVSIGTYSYSFLLNGNFVLICPSWVVSSNIDNHYLIRITSAFYSVKVN